MPSQTHKQAEKPLEKLLFDRSLDARTRAQHATYFVVNEGLDAAGALEKVIAKADQADVLQAKIKEQASNQRIPEFYLGSFEADGQMFAGVTGPHQDMCLPTSREEIAGLLCGDSVLIDMKQGRIAGRDGALPHQCGEVAEVVQTLPSDPHGMLVRHVERRVYSRVSARIDPPDKPLRVGDQVLFDPQRRMAFRRVAEETDGSELLTPVSVLDGVSRDDVGAIHPAVDEILFRVRRSMLHPHWTEQMGARSVASYLFSGPTGTGKTKMLELIARGVTDLGEAVTGQRVSRLVIVDASSFYSSLFGQTEINIKSFFARLRKLGKQELRAKDGSPAPLALLVGLEECEAIFRARGEIGGSAHLFDRPLALILQEMSSIGGELKIPVVFVATTNRPDLMDPAALRRFGVRMVRFSTLSARQAASVLEKKIPAGRPLRSNKGCGDAGAARRMLITQVLNYLYGDDAAQGIAEVRLQDGERRTVHRRDLVTGAHLEEAVSKAIDECLWQSDQAGKLLGLDAEAIIGSLESQYANLASLMRPHNLPEHCPDWFAGEPLRIASVRPLTSSSRRPASLFVL